MRALHAQSHAVDFVRGLTDHPTRALCSFGAVAPVLLIFLRAIDIPERAVGFFLTATLLGDVVLSLFVTQTADLLGRRRMLALGSALMCASGVAFYLSHSFVVLLVAAIVGIISPTGNETGPFAALEQAMLSQLTEQDGRVSVRSPLSFSHCASTDASRA